MSDAETAEVAVTRPLPFTVALRNVSVCGELLTVASVILAPDVVASPDNAVAAVTNPFPLTVTDANVPTFELTVARVNAAPEVVASPDNAVAAVINPFPLTVKDANVPTLELTVERVSPEVTFVEPLKFTVHAPSPVIEILLDV